MPQFYRGTKAKVRNKIARVLIAPSSYNIPVKLSEIISLTTYDPNGTYGFEDLGYTLDPVSISLAHEQAEISVQQEGVIKTFPVEQRHAIRTRLAEVSMATKRKLFNLEVLDQDTSVANENRLKISKKTQIPSYRLAILELDELQDFISGTIYPKAQVSASTIEEIFDRNTPAGLTMEFAGYPNDDNFLDSAGLPVIRIDLEQA